MGDDRIELESRIAFQERTIEQLSGAILDHERRIEELESQLGRLIDRLAAADEDRDSDEA